MKTKTQTNILNRKLKSMTDEKFGFRYVWKIFATIILLPLAYVVLVIKVLQPSETDSVFIKWFNLLVSVGFLIVFKISTKRPEYQQKKFSSSLKKFLITCEVLYTGQSLTSYNFLWFYFYESLDMIPLLDILKTFNLSKTITANYWLSSSLLLIYKVFFIYLVIHNITEWSKQATLIKSNKKNIAQTI